MTEFERYACYDRNIGSATLGRYGAALGSYINPAVIEERKLNATSIDVFSRLLMDRIIWKAIAPTDICRGVLRCQAESNRCSRFCRPVPNHSAIAP